MPSSSARQRLRERLTSGPLVIAPGIYDAYGARLTEMAGFEAVYMTGNGVSASLLGRADVGLVDLTMFAEHAHRAAAAVDIPLICDADTGYGNAVNVRRTVEEFEAGGVAAIHLEDQVMPKKCGHIPGVRPVVPLREHAKKIEAAVAARRDPDFLIIARTDAAGAHGLDDAIARVKAYRQAGADVIFVETKNSPTLLDDMRRVTRSVDAPALVNVEEGGALGQLTTTQLQELGFRIAIYPGLARYAAGFGIRQALDTLKRDGNTRAARERMLSFKEYNEALKLDDIVDWERRYLPPPE
ncbi:MAG: isocitrate lyase/PEP mutase family protein [Proteobacteria bacterium]|nr:isocitrate lyase/PEP mutase family protein [Burkholderiales bacterium]